VSVTVQHHVADVYAKIGVPAALFPTEHGRLPGD
jgi:hypothetical protein